jgi:hypothetical protein
MTFDAFQRHLTTDHRSETTGRPFGRHAAGDYPSRLRRMESLFDISLENTPPMVLRELANGLRQDPRVVATVPRKVMGDLARALREYADFLDWTQDDPGGQARLESRFLDADAIVTELRSQGFAAQSGDSKKIVRLTRDGLSVYVRLDRHRPLVVHPAFEEFFSTLAGLTEDRSNARVAFWHNAGLLKFPKRDNGSGLIHYGIAFGFGSTEALRNFAIELYKILPRTSPVAPEREFREEIQEIETEKTVLEKARIGQGRFRADLLNLWHGHCAVTEVSSPELLRASHIKSWRDSNNRERLDAFNGLLLVVHLDALFDRALISFENSGEMLVSKHLAAHERTVFGLAAPARKLLLNVSHLRYMQHHRERFGANEQKY